MSAGTGRNFPYYRLKQLSSLTLTDTSRYMLWHASQKWRDKQAAKAVQLPVSFFLSDAQHLAPAPDHPHAGGETAAQQHSPQRRMQIQENAQQHAEEQGKEAEPVPAPVSSIFTSRTGGFAEGSFDSVVDTFGLCSHSDPVAVLRVGAQSPPMVSVIAGCSTCMFFKLLAGHPCQSLSAALQHSLQPFGAQEMARVCRPDGRILLLEHGRAGWDWLDGILDRGESKHLRKWGCQWNRDIEAIVAQVRALCELCTWASLQSGTLLAGVGCACLLPGACCLQASRQVRP